MNGVSVINIRAHCYHSLVAVVRVSDHNVAGFIHRQSFALAVLIYPARHPERSTCMCGSHFLWHCGRRSLIGTTET
jgi:hypothetical protein